MLNTVHSWHLFMQVVWSGRVCISYSLNQLSTLTWFSLADALDDASLCSWHQTNYPLTTVDFGTNITGNCFTTATNLLNYDDYRGVLTAASRESAAVGKTTILNDANFVKKLTSTLRLGCAFDSGEIREKRSAFFPTCAQVKAGAENCRVRWH